MNIEDEVRLGRKSYDRAELDEGELPADPVDLFRLWMEAALRAGIEEPNAMALATAGRDGSPNVRYVLLRGFDERGFCFYTNLDSVKAAELSSNPEVCLAFYWRELERQVRIGGRATLLTREESAAYFASRPRGHQLSAWASRQSSPVESRAVLESALAEAGQRFPDDVPLPPFWGGYRVKPDSLEFWQGRANRLHDRIRYRCVGGHWGRERLCP